MVPVIDAAGKSVPLPTHALTRFGYGIEFDSSGRYREHRIDDGAMAEHLFQLRAAATARDVGIALVFSTRCCCRACSKPPAVRT
jgi:penicillin-insensitive murein DD-endopeptidase